MASKDIFNGVFQTANEEEEGEGGVEKEEVEEKKGKHRGRALRSRPLSAAYHSFHLPLVRTW